MAKYSIGVSFPDGLEALIHADRCFHSQLVMKILLLCSEQSLMPLMSVAVLLSPENFPRLPTGIR